MARESLKVLVQKALGQKNPLYNELKMKLK